MAFLKINFKQFKSDFPSMFFTTLITNATLLKRVLLHYRCSLLWRENENENENETVIGQGVMAANGIYIHPRIINFTIYPICTWIPHHLTQTGDRL